MLKDEDGKFLLKIARESIEKFVRNERTERPAIYPGSLDEKMGVFCTLLKRKKGDDAKKDAQGASDSSCVWQLRGCIGMPYPTMSLIDAIVSAATSVCEDPRFERLEENELNEINIEVSVLTEPVLIEASGEDYLNKIEAGKHGLILSYGPYSGLFLPQVWEQLPDKVQFLDNLCLKAGLSPGMWKEKGIKLYCFEVQVFEEK